MLCDCHDPRLTGQAQQGSGQSISKVVYAQTDDVSPKSRFQFNIGFFVLYIYNKYANVTLICISQLELRGVRRVKY